MNADTMPIEIAIVILVELLFGLGYNALVAYWMTHRIVHVSVSVVIGVTGTLLIPAVVWFDHSFLFWEAGILLVCCFSASGVPMIVGSMRRTVKDQKKRRPIGNTAARIRDEAVMEVNTIINDVTHKAEKKELEMTDYVAFVGRLHALIGMLKSI